MRRQWKLEYTEHDWCPQEDGPDELEEWEKWVYLDATTLEEARAKALEEWGKIKREKKYLGAKLQDRDDLHGKPKLIYDETLPE